MNKQPNNVALAVSAEIAGKIIAEGMVVEVEPGYEVFRFEAVKGIVSQVLQHRLRIRRVEDVDIHPAIRWYRLNHGRYEEEDPDMMALAARLTAEVRRDFQVDGDPEDVFMGFMEWIKDHESTR